MCIYLHTSNLRCVIITAVPRICPPSFTRSRLTCPLVIVVVVAQVDRTLLLSAERGARTGTSDGPGRIRRLIPVGIRKVPVGGRVDAETDKSTIGAENTSQEHFSHFSCEIKKNLCADIRLEFVEELEEFGDGNI